MADSSLMPALIGLGGTFTGSAIVLTSQWLLEGKKQEAEKKKRKAEKLEELVSVIYEHHHWLQHLYLIKVQGDTGAISVTPFAKIEAITHIYFPQFNTLVNDLALVAITYQEITLRNAPILQQLDLSIDVHGPVHTGFIQAKANYQHRGNILLDQLKAYAKREFQ